MMSYYVTVVFGLPYESEYRFTMYPNPDSLIEYPLNPYVAIGRGVFYPPDALFILLL